MLDLQSEHCMSRPAAAGSLSMQLQLMPLSEYICVATKLLDCAQYMTQSVCMRCAWTVYPLHFFQVPFCTAVYAECIVPAAWIELQCEESS